MTTTRTLWAMLMLLGRLAAPAGAESHLTLTLEGDEEPLVLGEPVAVTVTLRNTGAEPAVAMGPLGPEDGFVEFTVTPPGGAPERFRPWALKEHVAPERTVLPGEAVVSQAKLFFGARGWTFDALGTYEVRATYLEGVTSNAIAITIESGSDEPTRRAARHLIESVEAGRFLLLEGGDHLADGMRHLEEVAVKYPGTLHAAHANFVLGRNLQRDFAHFGENRLRPANLGRAVGHLERAVANPARFDHTVRAHLALAEAHERLGRPDRAGAVRQDLERTLDERFPGRQPAVEGFRRRR